MRALRPAVSGNQGTQKLQQPTNTRRFGLKPNAEYSTDGYMLFGRIYSKDITDRSHWVELSNVAWNDAHAERKARFKRMNEKRTWSKTEEARLDTAEEAEQLTAAPCRSVADSHILETKTSA